MKLGFSPEDEAFRATVADWLAGQMSGDFSDIRGVTGVNTMVERRKQWEVRLGEHGWSVIGWPKKWGGRDASLIQQVIFAEEYARSGAPSRIGHPGLELAGPTILHFGSEEQKQRFLPDIAAGKTYWAQGFSEPNAGSDLSNLRTKARLDEASGEWVLDGQKVWTSLAHLSDWLFVLARTEEGSKGPKGITFFLVPTNQPGVTIRPIRQINGDSGFNETFFDGARTAAANVVGEPGKGWQVAMGVLSIERGVSALGQQMGFRSELNAVIAAAQENGAVKDAHLRQRIVQAELGLRLMRYGALRMLSGGDHAQASGAALTYKIQWSSWRRKLGELAMDVLGQYGEVSDRDEYRFSRLSSLFLGSRSDPIHGGTNQIQRNIIAERALGLPKEPRGSL